MCSLVRDDARRLVTSGTASGGLDCPEQRVASPGSCRADQRQRQGSTTAGATPITPLTAVDLNRALAAHLIQRVEFVLRQRNRRRRDILDKVGDFGGSRDRHNDW